MSVSIPRSSASAEASCGESASVAKDQKLPTHVEGDGESRKRRMRASAPYMGLRSFTARSEGGSRSDQDYQASGSRGGRDGVEYPK